jgi:heme/copper-type cytochrome/quinol oxidase subunit 1
MGSTLDVTLTISMSVRILALILLGALVIPRQLHELKKRDRLTNLKMLLLSLGVGIFLTGFIPLFINLCRVSYIIESCETNQAVVGILAILFALNTLFVSVILYLIYNTKYNKYRRK